MRLFQMHQVGPFPFLARDDSLDLCGSSGAGQMASGVIMRKSWVEGMGQLRRSVRVALALTFTAAAAGLAAGPASAGDPARSSSALGAGDAPGRVTVDVTVEEYDASGTRLRSTYSTGELAPDATPRGYASGIVPLAVHSRTGCHTIAIRSTGWSVLGFIMWRYRVATHSCWNKTTRRVTHPADDRRFTRIDSVHVVDHRLIPGEYVHHFYNPDNGYDPFPLPGLNSHSAYYHRSKGEVHGPCLALHTCYERPWGSIRSLYNGSWRAKSGGNGFATVTKSG
jgi:hypothetical protein